MKHNQYNLSNKTAIITGALGLLGPEWAIALQECGANIVLTDIEEISSPKVQTTRDRIQFPFQYKKMDVTKAEEIQQIAHQYSPDILINNAALDPKVSNNGLSDSSRFEDISLDFWKKSMSVTLEGTFLCCQIFGNEMITRKTKGVIINIASELSFLAPDQRLYEQKNTLLEQQPVKPVTYMVAKAGVVALTKYLATYPTFLKAGIRVNALSPSGVYNNHPDDFVKKLSYKIPLGRMANKEEYRGSIQFLASDASSYMNGHNLIIDGGKSIW